MHSRSSLFLLLVVGLTVLSGVLMFGTNKGIAGFKQGLDVQGGVRFTYQMVGLTDAQKKDMRTVSERLHNILLSRSSGLGVVEANVQSKGEDQYVIELPGYADIEEAKKTMSSTAKLQVFHAKNVSTEKNPGRAYDDEQSSKNDVEGVRFTKRSGGKTIAPGDPDYYQMIFGVGAEPGKRGIGGWDVILEGSDLADAYPVINGDKAQPHFKFSEEGGRKLSAFCRKYQNGEKIAFVLDGKVLNIAPVKEGQILSTEAFIDGQFPAKYVNQLSELLKAGSLPVELKLLSSEHVDATIGQFALGQMITAGSMAIGLVCAFLLYYYAFPGMVATVALLLYMLFTLTLMKSINATFSLAAIAAFILSVGIAVDANILVFERVKEEIRNGKTLSAAVELGFKRALTAIIDANACTILTSVVLWFFGTGPVKGFASTLIIGVLMSFFTAVTVTRSLLVGAMSMGWFADQKYFALNRNWYGEHLEIKAGAEPLKIISKTKRYFTISLAIIIPGIIWTCPPLNGIKPNVEFVGGFEGVYQMDTSKALSAAQIRGNLTKAGFEGANVKFASSKEKVDGKDVDRTVVYITIPDSILKKKGLTTDDKAGAEPKKTSSLQFGKVGAGQGEGAGNQAPPAKLDPKQGPKLDPKLDPKAGGEQPKADKGNETGKAGGTETPVDPKAGGVDKPTDPNVTDQPVPPPVGGEMSKADAEREAEIARINAQDSIVNKAVADAAGIDISSSKGFTKVGATISSETLWNAVMGVIVSSALIVVWLAFRFGVALGNFAIGLRFGFSAVIALVHDVFVVVGTAAILGWALGWEVSALFITSVLTVIGFSVHDTIVIFDRIRENLRKPVKGETFEHLTDRSVTQSIARSINTSMMAVVPLIFLIVGGTPTPELKFMCVSMLIGIIIGTYSSIFNAAPILNIWNNSVMRRKGEQFGLMAEAAKAAKLRAAGLPIGGPAQTVQQQTPEGGAGYGTIKRRSSAVDKATRPVDHDDE